MSIFYGTPTELSAHLLSIYSESKTFELSQINYSPSADIFVGDNDYSTTSGGETLSIRFDNSSNEQLTDTKLFDNSYINFDRKIFMKGNVYQLTLLSVYSDSSNAVKVNCPDVSGSWTAWETHWSTNTITDDCNIYAVVNLLNGEKYIPPACVETTDISDGSVTTEKLADGSVTASKLDESYAPALVLNTISDLPEASSETVGHLFLMAGEMSVAFVDTDMTTWSYQPGHIYVCRETGFETGIYRWYDMITASITASSEVALGKKQTKALYFTAKAASDWTADTTYTDYGYRCDIACTGVTSSMLPTVIFSHADAVSGNYSPVSLAGSGTVTIYSKVNTAITIPSIKCEVLT